MKRRATMCSLVACLCVLAGVRAAHVVLAQAAAPARKACDYLTASDAEALLGTTVQNRSQGADCFFVETGWTNTPPKNKAIRFGLTDSATARPDEVVTLRRNHEQYMPPGGSIRDISGFADAAYWLWIPNFGGTLTAFRGGTTTVSVNITGLSEAEALAKAKALAAKPLGGSGPSGFAYRRPTPDVQPSTSAAATPTTSPGAARTPGRAVSATRATRPAKPAQTYSYFCYSDSEQPTIYVTATLATDWPVVKTSTGELPIDYEIEMEKAGFEFDTYLIDTTTYVPGSTDIDVPDKRAFCFVDEADVVERYRRDWEAKQAAARKKLVRTDWKYVEGPKQ